MVSRLILNLRTQAFAPSNPSFSCVSVDLPGDHSTAKMLISSAVVGNLGQPVSSWFDDEDEDLGSMYKPSFDSDDFVLQDTPAQDTLGLSQDLRRTQSHILVAVTQNVTTDIESSPVPLPFYSDPAPTPEPFRQPPIPAQVASDFPREPAPFSNTLAPLSAQRRPSSARSHGCGEDRSGVWLPPRTWRLDEGIPLSQLGRTRRSFSS